MGTINEIINIKISSLSFEKKILIKNKGRLLRDLNNLKCKYKKGKN